MADYLELMLFSKALDEISISDAIDLVAKGVGDLEDVGEPEEDDIQPLSSEAPNIDVDGAEQHDRNHVLAETWFAHISYRAQAFGTAYPFALDKYRILTMAKTITPTHFLYLFLLACSRMKALKANKRNALATIFEKVSVEVLKHLLRSNWIVRHFGAHSDDRRNLYGSKLKLAIPKLATELGEKHHADMVGELAENDTGDGGLDICAYLPLEDPAPGKLILFGQCAAKMDAWPQKTLESHGINWSKYIHFTHQPTNVVFVPVCYRRADGGWEQHRNVYNAVLIDRLRICKAIGNALPSGILPLDDLKKFGDVMVAH